VIENLGQTDQQLYEKHKQGWELKLKNN